MSHYRQGFFKPTNPSKYKGDHTKIVYRSGWELKTMMDLDKRDDVIEWQSEEFWIPYISPKDGKVHRYFPDFLIKQKNKDGEITTFLLEVKPLSQTKPPEKKKKVTKSYLNEIMTYAINDAKWKFAKEYCEKKGWIFQLFTEEDLKLKG